jgi:hypothetical protein
MSNAIDVVVISNQITGLHISLLTHNNISDGDKKVHLFFVKRLSAKVSVYQREIWTRACLRFKIEGEGFEIPTCWFTFRLVNIKLIILDDIEVWWFIFPNPTFIGHSRVALAEGIDRLRACGIIACHEIKAFVGHVLIK